MDSIEPRDGLLLGALAIGVVFGVLARASGFCFRSAMLEVLTRRPATQAAAWLIAVVTAVIGTQILATLGIVDLSSSIYLASALPWGTLVLGGFVFGVGMMLTRGCGARHLVLAASGNLRSWIVLLSMGLTAYATARGVLALPRVSIAEVSTATVAGAEHGLAGVVASSLPLDPGIASWLLAAGLVIVATGALVAIARRAMVLRSLVLGAGIGALVPAAWVVTGVIGHDEFEPSRLEALSFTAPVGNGLQFLMTYTGASADFGMLVVAGVVLGAFLWAVLRGRLRLEGFDDAIALVRYWCGGALMGFGGVLALGCTIGAGLSGISTLSLGSLIATISIVVGAAVASRVFATAAISNAAVRAPLHEVIRSSPG